MNGTTHLVVGIAAGMWAGYMMTASFEGAAAGVLGGAVGGLLPDIDHVNSKLGHRAYPVSRTIQFAFGHRTITHSALFLLFLLMLAMLAGHVAGYAGLLAAALHVICDMMTPRGVPLLYPARVSFRLPIVWRFSMVTEMLTLLASGITIALFVRVL